MHDNAHARDDAHAKVSSQPQAHANASFQSFHPIGKRADRIHAMLLIENVGNLVCPAMWDLGERAKVAVLSVTEGEDKPLKYPDMFAASQLMILNKVDLLPYVDFNVEHCIEMARQVNPRIEVLQLSARTGEGMQEWIDWLLRDSESETTSNIAASQQDAH